MSTWTTKDEDQLQALLKQKEGVLGRYTLAVEEAVDKTFVFGGRSDIAETLIANADLFRKVLAPFDTEAK